MPSLNQYPKHWINRLKIKGKQVLLPEHKARMLLIRLIWRRSSGTPKVKTPLQIRHGKCVERCMAVMFHWAGYTLCSFNNLLCSQQPPLSVQSEDAQSKRRQLNVISVISFSWLVDVSHNGSHTERRSYQISDTARISWNHLTVRCTTIVLGPIPRTTPHFSKWLSICLGRPKLNCM